MERPQLLYFNSRPHGGRLKITLLFPFVFSFQLTPSRRATGLGFLARSRRTISTHALTEGDTFRAEYSYSDNHFNSRPHGGRRPGAFLFSVVRGISTHALTEGDHSDNVKRLKTLVFQLTPSRRATIIEASAHRAEVISTHALTEGDLVFLRCSASSIFQLTPSRRATACSFRRVPCVLFQLTPSRRATDLTQHSGRIFEFQLTPSRRATTFRTDEQLHVRYFNSRPHGGRRSLILRSVLTLYFNSRHHGGRR